MKSVYAFDGQEETLLSEVGGKGLSLILMTRHGLPVPPGFVLSTAYFDSWFDTIKQTPEWAAFLTGKADTLKQDCQALKDLCSALPSGQRLPPAWINVYFCTNRNMDFPPLSPGLP